MKERYTMTGRKTVAFMLVALLVAASAGAAISAPGVFAGDKAKGDDGKETTPTTPPDDTQEAVQDNDLVDVDGNNNTININNNNGNDQDGQEGTDTVSNEQIVTVVNNLANNNENLNDIDNVNSFDAELLNDFLDIILGDQINDGDDVTDGDGDSVSIVRSCEAALVQADVSGNLTVEVDVLDVTNNTTATVDAGPVDGTTTVSIGDLDLTGTGVDADTSVITDVRVVDEEGNVVAVDTISTQELIDCILASGIDIADLDPDLAAQLGLTDGTIDLGALEGALNDTQLAALDSVLTDDELATLNAAVEAGTVSDAQVSAFADAVLSGDVTEAEASAAVTSGDISAAIDDLLGTSTFPALDGALNDTQFDALDGALNDTELATLDAALDAGTITDTQVSALADGLISGDITGAEASAAVNSGDIDAALTDLLTSVGLLSMSAPSVMATA